MISLNDKVIIAFSDTHGNHRRLQVPEDADIVICAGEDLPDDIDILVTHCHLTASWTMTWGL